MYSVRDWRVRRDFSFNLGLRYGDSGVYNEVNGVASNLYATNGSTVVPEPSPFQYGRLNNVALAVGRA